MAEPTCVKTCSVSEPSLAANSFHSRWPWYIVSVKAMPFTPAIWRSAFSRSSIFWSMGILKGSSSVGRLVVAVGRRPIVELDGVAQSGRGCAGDANGEGGDAIGLERVEPAGAGEAPRAVDQHADAEAFGLPERDAFNAAALDRDLLVLAAHDAHVGVAGTLLRGGVEGTAGKVSHEPRQVTRGASRGDPAGRRGADAAALLQRPHTSAGRRPDPTRDGPGQLLLWHRLSGDCNGAEGRAVVARGPGQMAVGAGRGKPDSHPESTRQRWKGQFRTCRCRGHEIRAGKAVSAEWRPRQQLC